MKRLCVRGPRKLKTRREVDAAAAATSACLRDHRHSVGAVGEVKLVTMLNISSNSSSPARMNEGRFEHPNRHTA